MSKRNKIDIARIAYLICGIISLMIYVALNRMHQVINILKTPIDDFIPLIPIFVIPYILYLPYLLFTIFWISLKSKNYLWFIWTLILIQIISGLIFYIYQTHVPRPEIQGDDILSQMIKMVYYLDKPYNCFPSTHVSLTTLCTFFWLKEKYFQILTAKVLLLIFATMVAISTIFVKQHYILDIFGGVAVAYLCIYLVYITLKKLKLKV